MLFSTADVLQTAQMTQIFADFSKGFSLKKNNSNGTRGFTLALFRVNPYYPPRAKPYPR
jgi:hypothetical protein